MLNFSYRALPWNIIFNNGAIKKLPDEIDKLGLKRVIVLVTPDQRDMGQKLIDILGDKGVSLFSQAAMHVPVETVDLAIAEMERVNADCCVSLGGGSTTGLGKALALKKGLPNIAIPTTYAGSEMTNIWGITENGRKVTGRDDSVVPTLTIYDPELTLSLPAKIAGPSGINAMAQAVVNIATSNPNPMVVNMALEAVRNLSRSLPRLITEPDNLAVRAEVLYGACLAGASLGTGVTSLHHRLCHTFGGSFNTPHAETHTILLPHAVAYNTNATKENTQKLAAAMGVENAAQGIFDLAKSVHAPTSLKEIGITENDLERAAEIATESPINNPEPVTKESLITLLNHAYLGIAPVDY